MNIDVGALTRDDQFASVRYSSAGKFSLEVKHTRTPHLFTDDTLTLFSGIGTDTLTLPAALTPGASTTDAIDLALSAADRTDLKLERTFNGFELSVTPDAGIELHLNYLIERREGERPFGGAFRPPFYAPPGQGAVIETAEPIDYLTQRVQAGIAGEFGKLWYSIAYDGSLFDNDNDHLTFENPFDPNPNQTFLVERGRFALYPDNESHTFKLDVGMPLGRGQWVASASRVAMEQDDDLLPPTVNSGITGPGVDLANWNTIAALSRSSADLEADTVVLYTRLTQNFARRWTFRATVRREDRDLDNDYTAFNPLTDEFGYIAVDGSFANQIFEPGVPDTQFQFRGIPYDTETTTTSAALDYRFARRSRLGIDIERETTERSFREVDENDEDRIKVRLSTKALSWATINLTATSAERDGGDYIANPYAEFFSASLPGYMGFTSTLPAAFTLDEMRMHDVADRDERSLKARVHLLLRDDLDVSLQWHGEDFDYDSAYGLTSDKVDTVNVDFNYQPSLATNVYAFWSRTARARKMANIADAAFDPDGSAGGPSFPTDRIWRQFADDDANSYGAGFSYHGKRFSITSDLAVNDATSEVSYVYASNLALASRGMPEPNNRGSYPDILHDAMQWTTKVEWKLNTDIEVALFHRFDSVEIDDWHFDGLLERFGNHLFLGVDLDDYEVHTVGISVNYRL